MLLFLAELKDAFCDGGCENAKALKLDICVSEPGSGALTADPEAAHE